MAYGELNLNIGEVENAVQQMMTEMKSKYNMTFRWVKDGEDVDMSDARLVVEYDEDVD